MDMKNLGNSESSSYCFRKGMENNITKEDRNIKIKEGLLFQFSTEFLVNGTLANINLLRAFTKDIVFSYHIIIKYLIFMVNNRKFFGGNDYIKINI